MRFFTQNFFKGILVLLPISLTAYISYIIFVKVDGLGRLILGQWITKDSFFLGIGFIFTVLLISLIGYLSSFWITSTLIGWMERQLIRSPIVKGIYGTIRDAVHSMFGEKKVFSQCVLIDLPALGYKRLGFVTQDQPTFFEGGKELIVVYMPHSFQVSGEMIIVPKSMVTPLDIPADVAVKLIMSAGISKS